jgi:hypothetical protein
VSSQNGGLTWLTEKTLSQSAEATSGASAGEPSVAVIGSRAYVTWADDAAVGGYAGASGNKGYVAVTSNGGTSWVVDVPLDSSSPDANNKTQVAATSNAVYVAMEYGVPGNQTLAYAYSRNGVTFDGPAGVALSGPDVDFPDGSEGSSFIVDSTSGVATLVYRDYFQNGNEPFASAVRIPHLELVGDTIMGQTVNFRVSEVPTTAQPGATFIIGLSATGTAPGVPTSLGLIHLAWDGLTMTSLADPGLTPQLQGNVAGFGQGVGMSTTWPLPAGSPTIYAVCAVLNGGGGITALTDPIELVSQ